MSHIVTIKTEVRDLQAIAAACKRLTLEPPETGTFKLFSSTATGTAVRLPDWHFPVVCNTKTGQLHYDNFNGRWGKQDQLDRFLQAYAVEKTRIEARRAGHTLKEQKLANGSICLAIQVAGGFAV